MPKEYQENKDNQPDYEEKYRNLMISRGDHDQGGRTARRMALGQPRAVALLAVLNIAPTYVMFMKTNWYVAGAYWHWDFLA